MSELGITHIRVDDTTGRLIKMLHDVLVTEPERPDLDVHTGHHLNEVARIHDDWERHQDALRLLMGTRLVNAAVEQMRLPLPE